MRKKYADNKTVLEWLQYHVRGWVNCVELKMVNFLLGQQGGYTKYLCFLCYWDSRATSAHWVKKDWTPRNSFMRGDRNIKNDPLVDTKQIVFPPLHAKLV